MSPAAKSSPLTELAVTIVVPALVLMQLTATLGTVNALLLALAFPLLALAAVGTALLMARLLVVLAAQKPGHAHAGLAAPWWALLGAGVAVPWWLSPPGAAALLGDLSALGAALWPVVLAAVLALAARRANRRMPAMPPGDLLVLLERLWAGLRQARPGPAAGASEARYG